MRKKKILKHTMANSDRERETYKFSNVSRISSFSAAGSSGGSSSGTKYRDSGRLLPRKKVRSFQQPRRPDIDGAAGSEDSRNKYKGFPGSSHLEVKTSQDSDDTSAELSACSNTTSDTSVPRQSTVAQTSSRLDNLNNYPYPVYLRPDYLDLLNEHAKRCPPQSDPWGVRNENFESVYRRLAPTENMGELGAYIYVNAFRHTLSQIQRMPPMLDSSTIKKSNWTPMAHDFVANNNLIRRAPPPVNAFVQRNSVMGAERSSPNPTNAFPHPTDVECLVGSAKELCNEQVGANDELAEIFARRNPQSSASSSKNETLLMNYKKTNLANDQVHYQQYLPKNTSASGTSVTIHARASRDDRMYATAGTMAGVSGVTGGPPPPPPPSATQYQYNPSHAPLSIAPTFDARRMYPSQHKPYRGSQDHQRKLH